MTVRIYFEGNREGNCCSILKLL